MTAIVFHVGCVRKGGVPDTSVCWLHRAVDHHLRDLIYPKVEPAFDPLRADRRFTDLARRAIP